jgi:hypothetical protein
MKFSIKGDWSTMDTFSISISNINKNKRNYESSYYNPELAEKNPKYS